MIIIRSVYSNSHVVAAPCVLDASARAHADTLKVAAKLLAALIENCDTYFPEPITDVRSSNTLYLSFTH